MLPENGSTTQVQANTRPPDERFVRLGFAADLQAIFDDIAHKAADVVAGSARPALVPAAARPVQSGGDISHEEFVRQANALKAQHAARSGGRSTLSTPSGFARIADAVTGFFLPSSEPDGATRTMPAPPDLAAVRFDPEMARLATITGNFTTYRAWLYIRAINDGSGKIARADVFQIWKAAGVATSDRHARRIMQNGNGVFWHIDRRTNRVYVAGVERLAARQYTHAQEIAPDTLETNKPGNRHDMLADLSGDIGTAQAVVYAAWISSKSDKHGGVTIARDTLCRLWRVSVPTLISWENAASVGKRANYAQAPDNSTATAPAHAYLNLHRDGSTFASWRLPNTYYVRSSMKSHTKIGKARKVRQTVQQIAEAAQRGFDEDAALPVQTKRYFVDTENAKAFKAAETYVRRVARKDGDITTPRYFAVGMRRGVAIFEPFDVVENRQHTHITQRNIWQEMRTTWFLKARRAFRVALADGAKWR